MKKFVVFLLFYALLANCRHNSMPESFIAVNLVGYNADAPKKAFLVNAESEMFEIIDAADSEVIYSGQISKPSLPPDSSSGDTVSIIDFSEFKTAGNFIIRTAGPAGVQSKQFSIGSNLYKNVTLKTVQSYYYARCGTAVDNGEPWRHSVCHLNDAPFFQDSTRHKNVTGGWHDAGDYNKFSITTALSAGLLLYLYEMRPQVFADSQLNIPEAGNGVPDLLDEVRWALEWMMKMQNAQGAVYHKVSQKKWVGEFMPDADPETRYIFRPTSNSTAGFTAVAALGARLFKPFDPIFSEKLSKAALKSWGYLEQHPKIQPAGGFKNPPGVHGGEYSDDKDKDVRLWAAIELYKLMQDEKFIKYFAEILPEVRSSGLPPLSWKSFHSLAYSAFLKANIPLAYEKQKKQVLRQFKGQAERLLNEYKTNNYRYLLDEDEFYWGSNSVNLAHAFLLIQLYEQTGDTIYHDAALDQLHYTLGRNPLEISYMTGIGTSSAQNPYHQFSQKLGYEKPVPGMLVGGPNSYSGSEEHPISDYPAKSYEDKFKSYRVNETAINYTAIFAYVAGYFTSPGKTYSTN